MNNLQESYMHQPQVPYMVHYQDYLVLSIFNYLCCGVLFGILALIFSCQASDYYMNGNIIEGRANAKRAKIFNIIGITIGTLALLILVIILLANILPYFMNTKRN